MYATGLHVGGVQVLSGYVHSAQNMHEGVYYKCDIVHALPFFVSILVHAISSVKHYHCSLVDITKTHHTIYNL